MNDRQAKVSSRVNSTLCALSSCTLFWYTTAYRAIAEKTISEIPEGLRSVAGGLYMRYLELCSLYCPPDPTNVSIDAV
jgi:hypothetical protein